MTKSASPTQQTAEEKPEKPKKEIIDKRGKRGVMKKREEGIGTKGEQELVKNGGKKKPRPPKASRLKRATFTATIRKSKLSRQCNWTKARIHKQVAERKVPFRGEPNDRM